MTIDELARELRAAWIGNRDGWLVVARLVRRKELEARIEERRCTMPNTCGDFGRCDNCVRRDALTAELASLEEAV
jgi:hypothetical protein